MRGLLRKLNSKSVIKSSSQSVQSFNISDAYPEKIGKNDVFRLSSPDANCSADEEEVHTINKLSKRTVKKGETNSTYSTERSETSVDFSSCESATPIATDYDLRVKVSNDDFNEEFFIQTLLIGVPVLYYSEGKALSCFLSYYHDYRSIYIYREKSKIYALNPASKVKHYGGCHISTLEGVFLASLLPPYEIQCASEVISLTVRLKFSSHNFDLTFHSEEKMNEITSGLLELHRVYTD